MAAPEVLAEGLVALEAVVVRAKALAAQKGIQRPTEVREATAEIRTLLADRAERAAYCISRLEISERRAQGLAAAVEMPELPGLVDVAATAATFLPGTPERAAAAKTVEPHRLAATADVVETGCRGTPQLCQLLPVTAEPEDAAAPAAW